MKKAISYCLYGDKDMYCEGAICNAWLAPKIYPGWEMVLFYDSTVPAKYISLLKTKYPDVRLIDRTGKDQWTDGQRMCWRYLLLDPVYGYSHIISRDCDSRLSKREAGAVQAWLEEGTLCHSMHDSESHNIRLMGGMIGLTTGWPQVELAIDWWLKRNPLRPSWGWDQQWLDEVVWPQVNDSVTWHDTVHLNNYAPIDLVHVGAPDGFRGEEEKKEAGL